MGWQCQKKKCCFSVASEFCGRISYPNLCATKRKDHHPSWSCHNNWNAGVSIPGRAWLAAGRRLGQAGGSAWASLYLLQLQLHLEADGSERSQAITAWWDAVLLRRSDQIDSSTDLSGWRRSLLQHRAVRTRAGSTGTPLTAERNCWASRSARQDSRGDDETVGNMRRGNYRDDHISLYLWLMKCSLNIHERQLVLIDNYVNCLWDSLLVWLF